MAAEGVFVKDVSIRISKELERKGHSKHKLDTTSWLVKIRENVENSERRTQPLYNTGSNAEGTDVTGSDRDAMIVIPNCIAIAADSEVADISKENHVFLMSQDDTRPCYTKLLLLQEGRDLGKNDLFQLLGGKEWLCVKDEKDRHLLSSEKFTKRLLSHVSGIIESSPNHDLSSFHVHGPCATFDNTVGKTKFDTDFAYSLPCNTFPKEALAFRSRHRQHGWPSETLIKKCFDQRCHIVAVGDKASQTNSLEWRISFALLEREFVWSLNDTQSKCYFILKMLLKMYIDKFAPDELSSYALKTLIFWCAETDDPSLWREENLLRCIYHCLAKLQTHVSEKRLPHFIVPENNLLATKFRDSKIHNKVVELISQMVKWHWSKLLQCPALSALNMVWKETHHGVRLFLRASRHPNVAVPFYQDIVTFRALQSLYMDINSYIAISDDLSRTLESFKATKAEDKGNGILEFGICALTFRISHILGNERVPRTQSFGADSSTQSQEDILYERTAIFKTTEENSPDYTPTPELSLSLKCPDKHNLTSAKGPDVCTGSLRKALNCLLMGEFSKAEVILQTVLDSYKAHVMYIGMCGPEELDLLEYSCYTASSGELSLLEKAQKLLVFDFTICRRDKVTPFLQREQLFWNEDAVPVCIHPRCLTYYLCFLSAYGQGQEGKALGFIYALSMHVDAMCKNKNLYSYIAWNLLGHCYFVMEQYGQAFRAFCNSLKSKPAHNPALFYIGHC